MPSHKAPGFSEVPADLFKQAPISFQKRIHLLVNEILTGRHDCDTELLMAKVILIHKDKDIAILDHYRPIALLNTIYQLIIRTTHDARTCTLMPNKSVTLSASACQVSLH